MRGVSKDFVRQGHRVRALEGVDLDVRHGEFLCLLGASGCGKSTLLNLIAGLEEPSAGSLRRPENGTALMFQDAALFPWLDVAENVDLALRLRGIRRSGRPAEIGRLLRLVRLDDAARRRVHELSGGMRQRVALARALAQDAEVLLMDEPFAALDAITRDLLHLELLDLWRTLGRTVVFVTHNVREAVALGQRVLLLSSRPGRVIGSWDTSQVAGHSPEAVVVAEEITESLRGELERHA